LRAATFLKFNLAGCQQTSGWRVSTLSTLDEFLGGSTTSELAPVPTDKLIVANAGMPLP
jgi:hypothetical protein